MSESLEDVLRRSAASGKLNHLSIAFTADGRWEAAYRGAAHADHRIVQHDDVAVAMICALTGRAAPAEAKKATKRLAEKPKPSVLDDL